MLKICQSEIIERFCKSLENGSAALTFVIIATGNIDHWLSSLNSAQMFDYYSCAYLYIVTCSFTYNKSKRLDHVQNYKCWSLMLQRLAMFDWWAGRGRARDGWRYSITARGVRCVTTTSTTPPQLSSVNSSATQGRKHWRLMYTFYLRVHMTSIAFVSMFVIPLLDYIYIIITH